MELFNLKEARLKISELAKHIKTKKIFKKKNKLAFVFAFTQNLSFAAGNCAIALNRHLKITDYDIVMLHSDLSDKDIATFNKIPHVVLKRFDLQDDFVDHMLKNIPKQSRFRTKNHLMCFGHFEAFSLLRDYEYVVDNDVDVSFQRDISDIISYVPFGIAPDTPWKVRDQFSREVPGYDMEREGYCSSVMVLSDNLPYNEIVNFLYEKAWEYADCLINPDQAIICLAVQKFNINPKLIPIDIYSCISWKDCAITAKTVHFGTEKKIWKDTNICNSFPEWYRTHLEWLELGGSDFDQSNIAPRNPLSTLNHFDELMANSSNAGK